MNVRDLIQKLEERQALSTEEYTCVIEKCTGSDLEFLMSRARTVREAYYGKDIYIRGLIEFTNYCKNDCYYCGIRYGNPQINRYRLSDAEILSCVDQGYLLGFRTFVLQGGEDLSYSAQDIGALVSTVKERYPDCAVTLSVGERDKQTYRHWHNCGADRYLLREETADAEHYQKLHPKALSLEHRMQCLYDLKEIGYQVGAGFMVGSPYQKAKHLVADLMFLEKLQPHMVGIGPFIAQKDSPFAGFKNGTLRDTLLMLALTRLTLPKALLPATTALATIHPEGRQMGILSGANVVMPNLTPASVKNEYLLYDHKLSDGEENAQGLENLRKKMEQIGYRVVTDRGDACGFH